MVRRGFFHMLRLAMNYRARFAWYFLCSIMFGMFTASYALLATTALDILQFDQDSKRTESVVPEKSSQRTAKMPLLKSMEQVPLAERLGIRPPGLPDIQNGVPWWMRHYAGIVKPRQAFQLLLLITLIIMLVKCIFMYFRRYLEAWLTQKVVLETQNQLTRHLLTLDLGYFQKERAGELLSRLTNDVGMLFNSVKLACTLMAEPMPLLFSLVVIFYLNWRLAILGLIAAPIGGLVMRTLSKKMRAAAKRSQEKRADLTSVMVQFLSGMRTVKAFACEKFEARQFEAENFGFFCANMRRERAKSRVRPMMEFVSGLGLLTVMVVGGEWVFGGKLELSELGGFLTALGMMYAPAKELASANSEIYEMIPGAERVFQILNLQPSVKEGQRTLPAFSGTIRFENVNFEYTPGTPVLKDINFEIRKGECIALVGPSGGGKSTLTDLLLRFYDPQEGRITLDGVDLREVSFASLRTQIALVSQSPFLFNCSVRDNIAYGRDDIDMSAIHAAARTANIHDDILAQSHGYDTVVGERGENLSGGQRQRVAIARAIFKNAPILILDEATSALDSENERQVQIALEHLMSGRTSLVIAHRLSTIRHADRILVIEDGRLTAQGKHEELIASSPTYARLVQLQNVHEPERSKS